MSDSKKPSAHHAIAVQYDRDTPLPTVLAHGMGNIARKILEMAEEHHIPIHEDTTLVEMLRCLPTGTEIPEESFHLMAEVISFLYHTNREWQAEHQHLETEIGPSLLEKER